jgi:hypothetical protein
VGGVLGSIIIITIIVSILIYKLRTQNRLPVSVQLAGVSSSEKGGPIFYADRSGEERSNEVVGVADRDVSDGGRLGLD